MLALTLGEIFQVVFPARFVQLNSEEAGYSGDASVLFYAGRKTMCIEPRRMAWMEEKKGQQGLPVPIARLHQPLSDLVENRFIRLLGLRSRHSGRYSGLRAG